MIVVMPIARVHVPLLSRIAVRMTRVTVADDDGERKMLRLCKDGETTLRDRVGKGRNDDSGGGGGPEAEC